MILVLNLSIQTGSNISRRHLLVLCSACTVKVSCTLGIYMFIYFNCGCIAGNALPPSSFLILIFYIYIFFYKGDDNNEPC